MFLKNLAVRMMFILMVLGLTFNLVAAHSENNIPTDLQTLIQNTLIQEQSLVVNEQQKLIISGDPQAIGFGYAVDLDGNTAVVGTYAGCTGCDNRGAAYVFVRSGDTWTLQAKLTAADAGPTWQSTYFGNAVAIDGDTIVIGAFFGPSNTNVDGAAYVFVRSGTTWTQQARLNAVDTQEAIYFGKSVDVSGDTIIVGTPSFIGDDSAFIFVRSGTTWTQQAKLRGNAISTYEYFGDRVALDGDTALVGSRWWASNIGGEGSAYVFVRNGTTWTEEARLTADDPNTRFNFFGFDVDVQGNTAVIGAYGARSAYIFERTGTTWTQQTEIIPSHYVPNANFGFSVALDGDNLLVGSSEYYNGYAGGAHLFRYANGIWTEQAEYLASDAESFDRFAYSLALEDDIALIGAAGSGPNGAAYVFKDTPGVITELLVNGDFEQDTNADLTPDGWERVDMTADVIKCGNKGVLQGLCMYHFKGAAGEDSYLKQDIRLQNFDLQAGDTLTLDGYIDAKGTQIDTQARLLVKYTDTNLPNDNLYDRYFAATNGWTPLADSLTLTLAGEPRVVRVILQNNSTDGRVRFDAMSLKWQDNSGGTLNDDGGLIPLPNAPDNGLQSRK